MKINSLHDLYVSELQDLYNAENQIIKALPKMAKTAASAELRSAFEEHLRVTQQQVKRLEKVFGKLNLEAKGRTCEGMKGIIEEGQEIIKEDMPETVCDAALIGAAQRVEHYEIAAYGTVRTYAEQLGYSDQAQLLQETLDEEGETDKKLTQIAESGVNVEATRTAS